MAYTLDGNGLGTVTRERMEKVSELKTSAPPGQDSNKAIVVSIVGVLRVIIVEGEYAEDSPTPGAWVKTISDLNDGLQKKSGSSTYGYTYQSDFYGGGGAAGQFTVKIKQFIYDYVKGVNNSIVTYKLVLVEGRGST